MKHAYIYVYQTICEINNKSYIGVHATNKLNDGYIGSGIMRQSATKPNLRDPKNSPFLNAVRKHGYANFKRHILSFYDTYAEAYEEERFLVDKYWVKSNKNYNCALGGRGSILYWMTDEIKKRISEKMVGKNNKNYGVVPPNAKWVIQYDLKGNELGRFRSAAEAERQLGFSGISSCCLGKYGSIGKKFIFRYQNQTEYDLKTLEINLSKRHRSYKEDGTWVMSDACKKEMSIKAKGRPSVIRSKETREKLSKARTGKKFPHSEETKLKIGQANKGRVFNSEVRDIFRDAQYKYKKPIIFTDLNFNTTVEYESIRFAALKTGVDKSYILKVLSEKIKSKRYIITHKQEKAA